MPTIVIIGLKYIRDSTIPIDYQGLKLIKLILNQANYNKQKILEKTSDILKTMFPNIENFKLDLIVSMNSDNNYVTESPEIFEFVNIFNNILYSNNFCLDKNNIINNDDISSKLDKLLELSNNLSELSNNLSDPNIY